MPRRSWRRTTPSADALPDATLMEQVVAGDGEAFAHLLTRHERTLFNYLLRMTQDEALTADLMQETWLRVFQNASRYDTIRKFTTWLFSIAYHCYVDSLRWRQRLERHAQHAPRRLPLNLTQGSDDPQEHLVFQETLDAVRAVVRVLPEPQRTVFILRHYHGLSYQEISDIVRCSLGTVKSRIYYAVRHVQQTLTARDSSETAPEDLEQAE